LSDVAARLVRHVPFNVWFRWRRAVEETQKGLGLLEQEANAKTCASLVLRGEAGEGRWGATTGDGQQTEARLLEGRKNEVARVRARKRERKCFMRQIDSENAEDRATLDTSVADKYGTSEKDLTQIQREEG